LLAFEWRASRKNQEKLHVFPILHLLLIKLVFGMSVTLLEFGTSLRGPLLLNSTGKSGRMVISISKDVINEELT
jgi:hypothetical protein